MSKKTSVSLLSALKHKVSNVVLSVAYWKTGGCPVCAISRAFALGLLLGMII